MPMVSVEMMPVEFPIVNCTGAFLPDDEVTLSGKNGVLQGRVTKITNKTFGVDQQPGLAMTIAITSGKLSSFAKPKSFEGYTVTKKDSDVSGAIRRVGEKGQLLVRDRRRRIFREGAFVKVEVPRRRLREGERERGAVPVAGTLVED